MKVTQTSETRAEMRFKRRSTASNENTLLQTEKPAETFIDVLSRHSKERTGNNDDKQAENSGWDRAYLDPDYSRLLRDAAMACRGTYSDRRGYRIDRNT